MSRHTDSGDGDEYGPQEVDELADSMEEAFSESDTNLDAGSMKVTAQVEWAGSIENNGRGGVRTTKLSLPPGGAREVRAALDRARASAAEPRGKSYKAKGWQAQLRALNTAGRGPEARDFAGLAPSRETQRRWRLGTQQPGKRNRDAIERAYDRLRETAAPSRESRKAQRDFASTVTRVLGDKYNGTTIRLRDIESIHFE
jgi:hypothetical protein